MCTKFRRGDSCRDTSPRTLPDAYGGKVRRLQGGHLPLVDGVIGNAGETYFSIAPGLRRGPFDGVAEILGLAWRKMVDETRRARGTAGVDTHDDVSIGHPLLRIDYFPALVFVGRAGFDVGMFSCHYLPGRGVAVLEREPFRIRAVRSDHRISARDDRAEHISAQHDTVVHRDRHIPIDHHSVLDGGRLPNSRF